MCDSPSAEDNLDSEVMQLAISKARNECIRSAAQLLKGRSMLPPCPTIADAQRAQLGISEDAQAKAEFDESMEGSTVSL